MTTENHESIPSSESFSIADLRTEVDTLRDKVLRGLGERAMWVSNLAESKAYEASMETALGHATEGTSLAGQAETIARAREDLRNQIASVSKHLAEIKTIVDAVEAKQKGLRSYLNEQPTQAFPTQVVSATLPRPESIAQVDPESMDNTGEVPHTLPSPQQA